jgi:choline dehydrogenase-like flavoprotein
MKSAVIIGSGLAGSLISKELAKDCEVIMLEAGPENGIRYPNVDFVRKDFGVVKTFCIGAGGSTNLWHNGLMPLDPKDVHCSEFRQVLNEARPYTDRAASQLHFNSMSYLEEYGAIRSEMLWATEKRVGVTDGVDCLLYPKKFRPLRAVPRVDARYEVSEIEFGGAKGRIDSIGYTTRDGRFTVSPDFVVICAGTLGTPEIVAKMLDAAGQPFDQLGEGLADHPMGFVGKAKVKRDLSDCFERLSTLDNRDYICRTAIRMRSECGNYTAGVFFRPALTMENGLSIYKYKSKLGASKGLERIKNALSPMIFHPDILAEICSHLFGVNIPSRIYNILVIFEQKRGKNNVSYDGNSINVDWRITEEEMAVYNGIMKKVSGMLEPVAEDLVIRMPLTEDWLWSAAHHSGTVPLGNLPGGLVDTNLKVNFFDNVFICDGSIIQEHSYANTGLTIGSLALRLADHVRSI